MKLVWYKRAILDLEKIRQYIGQDNSNLLTHIGPPIPGQSHLQLARPNASKRINY